MKKYQYLFGPVPSRRFGRSLGIDLTPYKTCSMDCVFCQLGRTTRLTSDRTEYVPLPEVFSELEAWLIAGGEADFLTLAGSGEPTLHVGFGEVIKFAKRKSAIPVALLTNGTTMHLSEVREGALAADVVKLSLSAYDQASLKLVNRPSQSVDFDSMIRGMLSFRDSYHGSLWLEVFIVAGLNDSAEKVKRIVALAERIRPDKIHINTAVRPAAEDFVRALSRRKLEELSELFVPRAEPIADFKGGSVQVQADSAIILKMLRRRPCTAEQVAESFAMHLNEVSKHLGILIAERSVKKEDRNGDVYYIAIENPGEPSAGQAEVSSD